MTVSITRPEVVTAPTIDELVATLQREHAACQRSAKTTIEHAIRAGEALLVVREQLLPSGGWSRWFKQEAPVDSRQGYVYMRLATFKDLIPSGQTSIYAANEFIKGLNPVNGIGESRPRLTDPVKDEIKRLRDEGWSYKQIAKEMELSPSTVYARLNGGVKATRARRARAALREQERESEIRVAVKKKGGAIAEAYSMAERMDDVLGQAHREATEPAARRELAKAHEYFRVMRDAVVRGLGVES